MEINHKLRSRSLLIHIRPHGMSGKCGEIQLAFCPVNGIFQASKAVCNTTMIMQIPKISFHTCLL